MTMTFKQVRDLFWDEVAPHPEERRSNKDQNDYCTDNRVTFCDFVDSLLSDGLITESQADRITLK